MTDTTPRAGRPSSDPVFRRIAALGSIFCLVLAVVGAIVGFVVAGGEGLAGAIAGAVLSLLLVSVTAISMVIANRYTASAAYLQIFFGIVLGGWLLKLVVFIVALLILRDQPWLSPIALFITLVVGLLGGLVIDGIVIAKARIGYVSDPKA